MDIGVGLPATIPGVQPGLIVEWARKADEGPFSSIGALDRLVYPNFESMISLAAAAGATSRVRLITTILIAPLRNPGIFAKQAASLDAISGGRLTLGLGVGGREDDFLAAATSFNDRGKRFDEQLALMKRVWAGDPVGDDIGPIGPPPVSSGGPELLIGGSSPRALDRGSVNMVTASLQVAVAPIWPKHRTRMPSSRGKNMAGKDALGSS